MNGARRWPSSRRGVPGPMWSDHGVHDEEEAIQVRSAVLPGGAHRGAVRVRRALREGPPAGRRQLPGPF